MSGGVLFVCLGNICRSPLAEAIARVEFARAGLSIPVASAGTGDWHVGGPADLRACKLGALHGYPLDEHRAQQLCLEHYGRYDWLLAMDQSNLAGIEALAPAAARARRGLILDVAGLDAQGEVPDPYYGGEDDFLHVIDLLKRAIAELVPRFKAA